MPVVDQPPSLLVAVPGRQKWHAPSESARDIRCHRHRPRRATASAAFLEPRSIRTGVSCSKPSPLGLLLGPSVAAFRHNPLMGTPSPSRLWLSSGEANPGPVQPYYSGTGGGTSLCRASPASAGGRAARLAVAATWGLVVGYTISTDSRCKPFQQAHASEVFVLYQRTALTDGNTVCTVSSNGRGSTGPTPMSPTVGSGQMTLWWKSQLVACCNYCEIDPSWAVWMLAAIGKWAF
ncbi:hypothetical protein FDECE_7469 [Fusarium decemcellulare]|nr:hypothetical protein FDECE_7469 [Fusarium decemcellulare]